MLVQNANISKFCNKLSPASLVARQPLQLKTGIIPATVNSASLNAGKNQRARTHCPAAHNIGIIKFLLPY